MARTIAIANQKGGVGKTTTSINLAAGLAYLNKKVLLVDFDPQGNATQGVGHRVGLRDLTVYDAILNDTDVRECLKSLQKPPLDLLPANINLAGADLELAKIEENREQLLKNALEPIKDRYDYIIIDCPPSLGLLNTNALTAADSVLIPVQSEYYALEGITQLLQTIRLVQKLFNPSLKIEGVLLMIYKTYIPRNIKLSEAPSVGLSIYDYALTSEGAKAYVALTREVIANAAED